MSTYNGWANYETWAVGMFLDGNYSGEGTYREVLEMARQAVLDVSHDEDAVPESAAWALRDELKEWFSEQLPELDGIASDLLGAAVSEVNWQELAEAKIAEVAEES